MGLDGSIALEGSSRSWGWCELSWPQLANRVRMESGPVAVPINRT